MWSMIAAAVFTGLFAIAQTQGDVARLAMSGRLDEAASEMSSLDPVPGTTGVLLQLASGTVPDDLTSVEARLLSVPGDDWRRRANRGSALLAMTHLGYRLRGTGPMLVATAQDGMTQLLVYEAARDSAGVRDVLARLDAASRGIARRNLPPPLLLAEAELWLGDSAAALTRLLDFERRWTAMDPGVTWGMVGNGWTLGRTWMTLARLAAATQRPDDARRAHERLAELWAGADTALRAKLDACFARRASSEERVLLRPSRGYSERYRYDAVAWVRAPFQNAQAEPMLAARLTMQATERTAVLPGGRAEREQRFDSVHLELPVFRNAGDAGLALLRQGYAGMRGLVSETVTDSLGRVLGRASRSDAGVPGELRNVLESGAGLGPLGAAVVFPGQPVAAGDRWSDSLTLYVPGGVLEEGTRVAVTYTLLRIERIEGRRTAFIGMDASTGERRSSDGSRAEATLSGELVWDVDAGVAIRLAASLRAAVLDRTGRVTPARVLLTALRLPSADALMARGDN